MAPSDRPFCPALRPSDHTPVAPLESVQKVFEHQLSRPLPVMTAQPFRPPTRPSAPGKPQAAGPAALGPNTPSATTQSSAAAKTRKLRVGLTLLGGQAKAPGCGSVEMIK